MARSESGGAQDVLTTPAPPPKHVLRDGPVSKAYWKLFYDADANGDGQLSRDEATAYLPRLLREFPKLDSNGDGRLERAEYVDYVRQILHRRHVMAASGSEGSQ